jgi:serine phosphatase RsbU (regulator of sigma subunit)
MPFQPLTAALTLGGITAIPAQHPCHGETVSGDGLFVEIGRQDSVLFLLVDVMGHGKPAAQDLALLESQLLPDPAYQNLQPGELLTRMNNWVQAQLGTTGRFVTCLALLAEEQPGTLTGANASQPEPDVLELGTVWQAWHLPNGPPLGILLPPRGYQQATIPLTAGQQVLAFTDGVTEAGATRGKQFQHGLLQWFLYHTPAGTPADQVVVQLVQALQTHVPAGWPEDDTTIVCLQQT